MRPHAPEGIMLKDINIDLPVRVKVQPRGWFTTMFWPLIRTSCTVWSAHAKTVQGDTKEQMFHFTWTEVSEMDKTQE